MTANNDNEKIIFEALQIYITDALDCLWRLPLDFCGDIRLFIENSGFRSVPRLKCDSLWVEAFGKPLIYGLTGFEEKFEGVVDLVIDDGLLRKVVFPEEHHLQSTFLKWYPFWEAEETAGLKLRGLANRLHGEMRSSMSIEEKLDRRIGTFKPVDLTIISWAFQKITEDNGYTGWVRIKCREGGIRATSLRYKANGSWITTPFIPTSHHSRSLAKALKTILPQEGQCEMTFYLNRGLLNPK